MGEEFGGSADAELFELLGELPGNAERAIGEVLSTDCEGFEEAVRGLEEDGGLRASRGSEEVTLAAKTIVFSKGSANWDSAFETLVEAFKKINEALGKQGVKPNGPAMTIYTSTDDTGFEFQAGIPVAEAPKGPLPEGLAVGNSPDGRALKFIHRGSYDAMDSTYEAITNHLDEKRLEAKDLFVEYYLTDPLTTQEDNLVIEVYVPVK